MGPENGRTNRARSKSALSRRDPTPYLPLFRVLASRLRHTGEAFLWLMYAMDLRRPLQPCAATVPVEIGLAAAQDMEEVAALFHESEPDRVPGRAHVFRARLKAGSLCFVARIGGAIVAYDWIRVRTAMAAHDVRVRVDDDEIYTGDACTAQAWRGKRIHPALNYTLLKHAQDMGFRTAYTLVSADNAQSLKMMPRVGWTLSGALIYFRPAGGRRKPIWHVRGSAYPMPIINSKHFDDWEALEERPWSRMYRLRKGDPVMYLKIVPSEPAAALMVDVMLAKACPENVPAVIACDHEREAWLLTQDHGGTVLDRRSPRAQLVLLVETYAKLQAMAVANRELMACLPDAGVGDAVPAVLDFLRPGPGRGHDESAGAAYFLGERESESYFLALSRRRALLERHVAGATRLPATLNHGNLQPTNAAITTDGTCVLFSWTHAASGPAGMSLHALFGGCVEPSRLLGEGSDAAAGGALRKRLLEAYIRALAQAGYADEVTLRRCLPASITAGLLRDVLHFGTYRDEEPSHREAIRDRLTGCLEGLLDLCDFLSLKRRQWALDFAADYRQRGDLRRARRLLLAYLERQPDDATAAQQLESIPRRGPLIPFRRDVPRARGKRGAR